MNIHLALPGGVDWDFTDALDPLNEIFNFYRLTVVLPIVQCPSLDGYLSVIAAQKAQIRSPLL
jgi:hypothetical protein